MKTHAVLLVWCPPLNGSMRAAAMYHAVDEGMAEGAVVGK